MQHSSAKTKRERKGGAFPAPPRFAGEMLNVLSDIMTVGHLDGVLQKIGSSVAELFSMRTLVIGVLDESDQIFRVRATHGYDPESDKKIMKFTYTYERLKIDLDDRYRIADNVYLIRPKPEEFIRGEEPFYKNLHNVHKPRTDPNRWHELDYIRIMFHNREGEPIGFLEINDSVDDMIPDASIIEAIQIFAELAGVAIENATMFQRQVEIAQRSKFLSDIIAHDINNYNQVVTSYLQMVLESGSVPEKTSAYLQRASVAAWGISEMIQRANMLVKIENEGAANLGPVELGEVLRESIDEVLRENQEKKVKIDPKLGNHRYFVMGNELANDIFTNILDNAIKYDPHDKIVVDVNIGEFTVEPRKYWCVSIADSGIGIPDSKKNIVFGRFKGTDTGSPGSGLGLSIVRAIVEAYRGMVWVEDRVPGQPSKGCVFRVALPMTGAK
jgi:signal transduction histidine kinase